VRKWTKNWESVKKCVKTVKVWIKNETVWENMRKFCNSFESVLNVEKNVCENLPKIESARKCAKSW